MNPDTGEYVRAFTREDAADLLRMPPDRLVMVEGTEEQVEALSQRVRLGAAEQQRRRNRRKTQKQARRRNR